MSAGVCGKCYGKRIGCNWCEGTGKELPWLCVSCGPCCENVCPVCLGAVHVSNPAFGEAAPIDPFAPPTIENEIARARAFLNTQP